MYGKRIFDTIPLYCSLYPDAMFNEKLTTRSQDYRRGSKWAYGVIIIYIHCIIRYQGIRYRYSARRHFIVLTNSFFVIIFMEIIFVKHDILSFMICYSGDAYYCNKTICNSNNFLCWNEIIEKEKLFFNKIKQLVRILYWFY